MNFDILARQCISEAAGDLPPNIREFGGTGLTASGALGLFLSKKDRELLSASRGKAREEEGGEVFRKKLLGYKAAIAEGYKRLKAENFTPKDEDENKAVEEFKSWGLGEEAAEMLYVLGGKVAKNLWSLNNLTASTKDKKIPIIEGEKEADLSIASVAREALEKFYELFMENAEQTQMGGKTVLMWKELSPSLYAEKKGDPIIFVRGKQEGEETETTKIDPRTRGRLAFKQLIDVLRTFAPKGSKLTEKNKMFGWGLTPRQITGSNNYFALDIRSTPTHWFIYINKKGEGKEEGGKLRAVYGSVDDKRVKRRLQSDYPDPITNKPNTLPLKFVNGAPKYGVQLTRDDVYSTLDNFLQVIGYDTIYDVLYAKYVKNEKTFNMPDGKVLDLEKLKITEYNLTVPSVERRAREEKIATTPLRPESRPLPPVKESLESAYEKILIKE